VRRTQEIATFRQVHDDRERGAGRLDRGQHRGVLWNSAQAVKS
jgi:hypothetical protein